MLLPVSANYAQGNRQVNGKFCFFNIFPDLLFLFNHRFWPFLHAFLFPYAFFDILFLFFSPWFQYSRTNSRRAIYLVDPAWDSAIPILIRRTKSNTYIYSLYIYRYIYIYSCRLDTDAQKFIHQNDDPAFREWKPQQKHDKLNGKVFYGPFSPDLIVIPHARQGLLHILSVFFGNKLNLFNKDFLSVLQLCFWIFSLPHGTLVQWNLCHFNCRLICCIQANATGRYVALWTLRKHELVDGEDASFVKIPCWIRSTYSKQKW